MTCPTTTITNTASQRNSLPVPVQTLPVLTLLRHTHTPLSIAEQYRADAIHCRLCRPVHRLIPTTTSSCLSPKPILPCQHPSHKRSGLGPILHKSFHKAQSLPLAQTPSAVPITPLPATQPLLSTPARQPTREKNAIASVENNTAPVEMQTENYVGPVNRTSHLSTARSQPPSTLQTAPASARGATSTSYQTSSNASPDIAGICLPNSWPPHLAFSPTTAIHVHAQRQNPKSAAQKPPSSHTLELTSPPNHPSTPHLEAPPTPDFTVPNSCRRWKT